MSDAPLINDPPCPCGTGRLYGQCCGIWHAGRPVENAQQLMRSRYSAFVLQNEQYLLVTWHPSRRPGRIDFSADQIWLGLTVKQMQSTVAETAEVEFIALSRYGQSRVIRHHEVSRFVREAGVWLYIDGVLMH